MNAMETVQLAFHPLAEVLPLIEGKQFDELVASIKANGLRDPIILFEGTILDGRNRYRACLQAGVKPRTEEFSGGDPALFVADRNLHRRHLTDGQKAMAAAKLAKLSAMNKFMARPDGAISIGEAAKLANVCGKTITNAREIYTHGTPEEIAAVSNGTAAVTPTADVVRARRRGTKPPKRARRSKTGEGRTGLRQKTLRAIFQRALSLLANNCEHIETIDVPVLTEGDRAKAEKQLTDAMKAMRKLRDRVQNGGKNNG
jgi:hypothetical protein